MTWMWIAGGILAGLYLVKRKINNNLYTTTDTQTQENREQDAHNDGKLYGKRAIQEAVTAGEHALDSLRAVMERLDSARAWGVCDMLGAGAISSKYKYGKINDANAWMQLANHDLRTFEKKLEDVTGVSEYIRPGDMVSAMDAFCEHVAADSAVQKRISRAMAQTDSLIVQVGETVELLKKKLED